MKIEKLKTINNSDVMRQAYIAYADLITNGNAPGDAHPFATDAEAIFARDDDGMIVAFIIWRTYEQEPKDAWISMTWVAPHRRREGLYRRMLFCLREECISRGLDRIESNVMAKNKTMQDCKEALGFHQKSVMYRMDLPKAEGS